MLAPAAGLEPATCGLTVRCSTTELRRSRQRGVYGEELGGCQALHPRPAHFLAVERLCGLQIAKD
jgi:hypothetical protein